MLPEAMHILLMILSRTFGTAQWIFDAVSTPKAGTNKSAQTSQNKCDDPDKCAPHDHTSRVMEQKPPYSYVQNVFHTFTVEARGRNN